MTVAWKIPWFLRKALFCFNSKVLWGGPRPKSCYRQQRPVANDFDSSEFIYFHLALTDIESGRTLKPAAMPLPDLSVNRSGFAGRSWYVLLPQPDDDWAKTRKRLCKGIVRLRTCDAFCEHMVASKAYSFRVEHDPEEHNYHHCEIRVFEDGVRIQDRKPPTIVKKFYRDWLSDRGRVILKPEPNKK